MRRSPMPVAGGAPINGAGPDQASPAITSPPPLTYSRRQWDSEAWLFRKNTSNRPPWGKVLSPGVGPQEAAAGLPIRVTPPPGLPSEVKAENVLPSEDWDLYKFAFPFPS